MDAISPSIVRRRSRMQRQATCKTIELSARDHSVFDVLSRYRYMRSTYLHAFAGGASQTRFVERLGALYHDGAYIDRPAAQWECADARARPAVYELAKRGEEILRSQPGYVTADKTGSGPFRHALLSCEVVASIELAIRETEGVRFVPWREIQARSGSALSLAARVNGSPVTIIPDALFGIEYRVNGAAAYRFFALEVERCNSIERGNLAQTSWMKKILAYRDIAARKTYAALCIPNLMILAVSTSQVHLKHMHKAVLDATGGQGSSIFLFRSIQDGSTRPMPELFTHPWERAGRAPFHIGRA